jgi:hypothetical protein
LLQHPLYRPEAAERPKSVDEQIVSRARKRAMGLGKSLNEVIREYLEKLAGADDPERSIKEFENLQVAAIRAAETSTAT